MIAFNIILEQSINFIPYPLPIIKIHVSDLFPSQLDQIVLFEQRDHKAMEIMVMFIYSQSR